MTDRDRWLRDFLLARGMVERQTLGAVWQEAQHADMPLAQLLLERGVLNREQLARAEEHFRVVSAEAVGSEQPGDLAGPGHSFPGADVIPVKRLGSGAMGEVWLARDERVPGRRVAVKLIRPELADDPEMGERFLREAQAVAAVDHPNVIRIHRYGRSGDVPFLVMEFVEGASLDDRLKQGRGPDPEESARLVEELARGVSAAHAAGVLHRDIKPGNVLVESQSGRPILTDFGLARLEGARTLTKTGDLIGSPAYMAPEQARGAKRIDEKTDVYGLGATLYRLLADEAPYQDRRTVHAILDALVRGQFPRSLSDVASDLEPDLIAICERAMAPDPALRYPSPDALGEALAAYRRGEGVGVGRESKSALLWVGLLPLVVLLGFLAWSLGPKGKGEEEPSRPPRTSSGSEEESSPGSDSGGENRRMTVPPLSSLLVPEEPTAKSAERAMKTLRNIREKSPVVGRSTVSVPDFVMACRQLQLFPRREAYPDLVEFLGLSAGSLLDLPRGRLRDESRSFHETFRFWLRQEVMMALIALGRADGTIAARMEKEAAVLLGKRDRPGAPKAKELWRFLYVLHSLGRGEAALWERAIGMPDLHRHETELQLLGLAARRDDSATGRRMIRRHLDRFRARIIRQYEPDHRDDLRVLLNRVEALNREINRETDEPELDWDALFAALDRRGRAMILTPLLAGMAASSRVDLTEGERDLMWTVLEKTPLRTGDRYAFVPSARPYALYLVGRWLVRGAGVSKRKRELWESRLRGLRERLDRERKDRWTVSSLTGPLESFIEEVLRLSKHRDVQKEDEPSLPPAWALELERLPTDHEREIILKAFEQLERRRIGAFAEIPVSEVVQACRVLKFGPSAEGVDSLMSLVGISRTATRLHLRDRLFRKQEPFFKEYYHWLMLEGLEALIEAAHTDEGLRRIRDRIDEVLRRRRKTVGEGQKLLGRLLYALARANQGGWDWLNETSSLPGLTFSEVELHLVVLALQRVPREAVKAHLDRFRGHVVESVFPRYTGDAKEDMKAELGMLLDIHDVFMGRSPGGPRVWSQIKEFRLSGHALLVQALLARWLEEPIQNLTADRRRFVEQLLLTSPVDGKSVLPAARAPAVRLIARWMQASPTHRKEGLATLRKLRRLFRREAEAEWFTGRSLGPLIEYIDRLMR